MYGRVSICMCPRIRVSVCCTCVCVGVVYIARRHSVALIPRERNAGITVESPRGVRVDEPRYALWNAPAAIDLAADVVAHPHTRKRARTIENLSFFPAGTAERTVSFA